MWTKCGTAQDNKYVYVWESAVNDELRDETQATIRVDQVSETITLVVVNDLIRHYDIIVRP